MQLTQQLLHEREDYIYDVIVIGGGSGGLSAGVYLQRYLLNSLIIDKGKARSFWIQALHNYLGLPSDTPGRELLKQGKAHYLSIGGDLLNGYVEAVADEGTVFSVRTKVGRNQSIYHTFQAKYIIAASGIIDHLPQLENMQNVYNFAGYNLHVCLLCDGYEMQNQQVGVFCASQSSLEVVSPLSWFTPHITLFTNGQFKVLSEQKQAFSKQGIPVIETPIRKFLGVQHQMTGVELTDDTVIQLDSGLIAMGAHRHAEYLQGLDLECKNENLITDSSMRTSHARIFAVGDLKVGMNQVIVAASDGAIAATQIWRDIRSREGSRPKS
ncbi:MAG: NAD(P)/FAD-dependent oxidoreductase [Leptolyngbya sp. SIO4C1]|nr:NAD(P)/FAD-dependent oxidoreductase [Leptolyngbya sp. SIO4C1]